MSTSRLCNAQDYVQPNGPSLPKYLHQRDGVFYFKRKFPARIARSFTPPKKQVWKSLKTTDIGTAVRKLHEENERFNEAVNDTDFEIFGYGRNVLMLKPRGAGTSKYLQEVQIPSLLARYKHAHFATVDEERALASSTEIEEQRTRAREVLEIRRQQAITLDTKVMEDTAAAILSMERLIAPPGSKVRMQLLEELLLLDVEILQEQLKRLDGTSTLRAEELPEAPRAMRTMLDVFHAWREKRAPHPDFDASTDKEDRTADGVKWEAVSGRTIDTYRKFVDEFEAVCGALPVDAITIQVANRYRDYLAKDGLLRPTVQNHIGALGAMLRAATSDAKKFAELTEKNVFDFVELDMVPERADEELRRAYEYRELNFIFQSPVYVDGFRPDGFARESAYWAPLLGPFVGARLEEIAQLRIDDVLCIQGIWTLRIANLGPDQELKTKGSYRLVPIHQEVIQCGFLAYVADVKRSGHQRVFPSQRNDNKHRRWGNAFGKWYSAYLDKIGLLDDRLCYQSYRYTFKQQCSIVGVGEEVRDALAGHWLTKEMQKSSRGYMRGEDNQYPFEALVAAIAKLRYDEVDLSHLYVDEPLKGVEVLLQHVPVARAPYEGKKGRGRGRR